MTRRKRIAAAGGLVMVCAIAAGVILLPRAAQAVVESNPRVVRELRARWRGATYAGDRQVVLQRKRFDCGAAALKMVLAAHGIERDLGALEVALETTARGTSLFHLRGVATAEGLPARSWSLHENALRDAPLPAIAYVNGNHFVVVRRYIDAATLEIDDPALGRLRFPVSSFRREWKGETLVFDPRWSPTS